MHETQLQNTKTTKHLSGEQGKSQESSANGSHCQLPADGILLVEQGRVSLEKSSQTSSCLTGEKKCRDIADEIFMDYRYTLNVNYYGNLP